MAIFEGSYGDDTETGDYVLMDGGTGNDVLRDTHPAGQIVMFGGGGDDFIAIDDINNPNAFGYFSGGAGNDVVYAGAGKDQIYGRDGKDLLVGGLGQDDFWGGNGKDIFRFLSTADSLPGGSHRDVVKDFDPTKHDRIDVSPIDAKEGASGNQAFKFIGSHGFHDRAGELQFKNGIVRGDTNGDGHADFEIKVHIEGASELGQHDFVL